MSQYERVTYKIGRVLLEDGTWRPLTEEEDKRNLILLEKAMKRSDE